MLDTDTKRRIDTCRDILVGKVPDPKSQVEQITIALIYKFMDDMDAEAEELGGDRNFFAGSYAKYGWAKLMAPNMGGFDVLALYSEAIGKMNENPGIPQLFRDIFKNAYLPYRDPETLRSFLKEIDGFTYDHSERLGDAFEYLLSVLGSQGDAGQFRTPRHIIDFMVEVIDPKKSERVLDPACGTAGFLISAWKHILKQNTKERAGDQLTPDERANLAANIHGYDISPDMVRLSLVNMYLHGFTDPHIVEYDTLTSEERWNETADVILANPPFMSPKGGIKPHKRFQIQSKKSEALFVDYIIEHLAPSGRAAIVVPDGIVANPSTGYVQLRRLALNNGLFAVVSLHPFVFKPYAGAKTSILFFDRKRIRDQKTDVLFLRVDNDGFERGEQRRRIDLDDLPVAKGIIQSFRDGLKLNSESDSMAYAVVDTNEITGTLSLFANKYLHQDQLHADLVKIVDLFKIEKGSLQSTKAEDGEFDFITAAEEWSTNKTYTHDCEALVFAHGASGSLGRTHYVNGKFIASDLCFILTPKVGGRAVDLRFYHAYFSAIREEIVAALAKGAAKLSINKSDFGSHAIAYVPIETQQELGNLIQKEQIRIRELKRQIDEAEQNIEASVYEALG